MKRKHAPRTVPGKVELQLLRPGPPHNQLLSPLTEYLALCGDHPNTTLRIPLEHEALLTRLRALRYSDSEATRMDQLRETARIASDLLASVPGLIADLASDRGGGKPLVQLSIASRASELALFPFELALAPSGFPGAGQSLCLQPQLPVCMTRRSRNVRNDDFRWDQPVKILMVASSAGGDIPLQQHYALLRKLVEPWVATMPNSKEKQASGNEKDSDVAQARREEQARKKLHGVLQLVTPASLDDLRQKLQQESFTHIHILAHGCVRPRGDKNDPRELGQPKFGIAFHDQRHTPGEIDVVDGNRLAEVLRSGSACRGKLRPAVVTLAICDSSAQGDVVGAGGSVAFELHDAGIPLVVASQFPFSFEGSILLTDSLYRGFLCGEDPRRTLWDTRRRLHSGLPELMSTDGKPHRPAPHDWASLTVFAAFPDNLDQVLPAHQRDRQRTRMNACLENLDQWLDDFYDNKWNWGHEANSRERWNNIERELQTASERVTEFNNWVDKHKSGKHSEHVMSKGITASAQKRIGLLYLQAHNGVKELEKNDYPSQEWEEKGERYLGWSRQSYWQIFELSRNETWAIVQCLALDFALTGAYDDELWTVANRCCRIGIHSSNVRRRAWALTSLVELIVLKLPRVPDDAHFKNLDREAMDLARQLSDLFPRARLDVYSSYRQLERYLRDFLPMAEKEISEHSTSNPESQSTKRSGRSAKPTAAPLVQSKELITSILEVLEPLDFREFKQES